MSTKDNNIDSIRRVNLLSKKILSTTLLERLNNVDDIIKNKDVNNVEQYEKSWREKVRGACGLFDISGFSRLAAKLSNEENIRSSPKQKPGFKKSQNSNKKSPSNDSYKIKRLSSKGRRQSTIKALDTDTLEQVDSSIGSNTNSNRQFFRHADKILGEEMGKQGQGT